MNRKDFMKASVSVGLIPLIAACSSNEDSSAATVKALFPKMSSPTLANSLWYIGHLMSVLVSSKDTNGAFSLLHGFEVRGLEPPPHTHTKEDESFYLMSGEINYNIGGETLHAKSGDWVFLPKNIQHSFQVLSETAEVLVHLSPGGFENYFIEMSEPAKELVIPPRPQGPPDVKRIVETASKYGIIFPPLK